MIIEKIKKLKKLKNAVLLAHNYQDLEVIKVADFVGDSVELARKAVSTQAEIIITCGVHFMAESVKLLNKSKKVFLANPEAGCPMAEMCTTNDVKRKKEIYPQAKVVSYVNTSAAVKAESDICCTSANVIKVVNSLPEEEIIFTPDLNLASYVAEKTNKKVIPIEGYCYVHHYISLEKLQWQKEKTPQAMTLVHPECSAKIRHEGDMVTSTSGMIREVENSKNKDFIIITESGLSKLLEIKFPEKNFHTVVGECEDMKRTSLEDVLATLEGENQEIIIPREIANKAKKSLEKMLAL